MVSLIQNKLAYFIGSFFCVVGLISFYNESWLIFTVPLILFAIYGILFETERTFLLLFFFTPLSVNIEEYSEKWGLFLPTEPILFGLLLLLIGLQIQRNIFPNFLKQSLLIWLVGLYLFWLLFTSVLSTNPLVSFKFLLAKLWFIIPLLFYGSIVFQSKKNIIRFVWLLISGMTLTMLYTLITHATYQFGEKEGHWVMNPLFKDHTIYGALVAFVLPLMVALLTSKKHPLLIQFILFIMILINLVALYFSYTRAAWLSVVVAFIVFLVLRFKVKFVYLFAGTLIVSLLITLSWTTLSHILAKNDAEHTTEDFRERLESVSNISTDASNLERINRWSCAIDMFQERPFIGFGPNTYAFEYARFQKPENLTIISTNFSDGGNAHSEYLGALSEIGIIGLLIFLGIIVCLFYLGVRLYQNLAHTDQELRTLVLGMILALSTYFFHGFLNNYLDTDKASVPIWAIAAVFVTLTSQMKRLKED